MKLFKTKKVQIKLGAIAIILVAVVVFKGGFYSLNPTKVEPKNSTPASVNRKVEFVGNINFENTTEKLVSNNKEELNANGPLKGNNEVNNAEARMEKRVEKLIVDIANSTEDNLKDLFFENENVATAEKVITLLSIKDFNVLVDSFKEKDRSSYSVEREGKLSDALRNNLAGRYYNEKYACAGKLCVLEFTHSPDLDIADIDKIEEFDKNFVVLDYSGTTLQGDKVFQVLFVATDDPSKLGFRG
ncbi:hypothetical protein [Aliiglaciecola sp. M165]|uniref:hypothetical protein n=1 Tax=Aliiglaciecola sp. M165 TaxID=2593649 RepID=UPI00118034F5|nr:hypothetical protein [Aliiglaciecola sp. M165]TRY33311.1 hypothetical protein FM019_04850 [Aliiglaciecola sp. M165]